MKRGTTTSRDGQVAVVTGGARGLGLAFGRALAGAGAHVVLIDMDGGEVQRAAAALVEAGGSALGVEGDVVEEAAMARAMAVAAERHGRIDTLVNNAGLHGQEYSGPIADMGIDRLRRLFDVNVVGTACATLAALPYLAAGMSSSVVNISSLSAHLGGTAYGVSKLGVAGLTVTLARELGPRGIRVNAISPGLIGTDTIRAELPEAAKTRVKAMQLLDLDGVEDDVVGAMLYLSGPTARFITGEVLRVTGGAGAGV